MEEFCFGFVIVAWYGWAAYAIYWQPDHGTKRVSNEAVWVLSPILIPAYLAAVLVFDVVFPDDH